MTPSEAEIFLLKQELVQNHHTISFLHNCLINPDNGEFKGGFSYSYPEQTLDRLKEIEKFVTIPNGCFHSKFHSTCQNCINSAKIRETTQLAKETIQENNMNENIIEDFGAYFLRDDTEIRKNAEIEPNEAYSLFKKEPYARIIVFACSKQYAIDESLTIINQHNEITQSFLRINKLDILIYQLAVEDKLDLSHELQYSIIALYEGWLESANKLAANETIDETIENFIKIATEIVDNRKSDLKKILSVDNAMLEKLAKTNSPPDSWYQEEI